jgi:transposase
MVRGVFGDPKARVIRLNRRSKTACGCCGHVQMGWYDRKVRRVRDLSCGDTRISLDLEVRRIDCRRCGKVKRERLDFVADNPLYTKRFAYYVGRRCRDGTIKNVAAELGLDRHTVKSLEMAYMEAQLKRAGTPGPRVIGIDEIAIRKGHTYRIVVSDLLRGRPIWFGGEDHSAASMSQFYAWLGERKSSRLRLAVMDMWKPFRLATQAQAPQAAILFDKFHYEREGWARRFFDNWRASLKWQRLKSYAKFAAMIDRHWDGIAAYCRPENKVSLGFVEGLH